MEKCVTWPIIGSCKSWTSERQLFVFCLHYQCTFYQWTENWPKSAISRAWVCHFRNFAELQDKGALVQALCRQIYISATFCAKTRQHLCFPYIHWLDAQCTEKMSESWVASELEISNMLLLLTKLFIIVMCRELCGEKVEKFCNSRLQLGTTNQPTNQPTATDYTRLIPRVLAGN